MNKELAVDFHSISLADLLVAATMNNKVSKVPAKKPSAKLTETVTAAAVTTPAKRSPGRPATVFAPKLVEAIRKEYGAGASIRTVFRNYLSADPNLSVAKVKRLVRGVERTTTATAKPTVKHGEANTYRRGRRASGERSAPRKLMVFTLSAEHYEAMLARMKHAGVSNASAYIRSRLGF